MGDYEEDFDDQLQGLEKGRDEATSRNPIHSRLLTDGSKVSGPGVVSMVGSGRNVFHSFISRTIRRRYKRPPIYLVDAWVTEALGVFLTGSASIRSPLTGQGRSPPLQGFRPFVDFFDHLQMTREHLAGARLLANTELIAKLESACIALLSDPSALRRLMDAAGELQNRIRLAESVLVSSAETSAFVERAFAKACRDQIARLCELAEVMSRARRPEVPGFDFDSRGGGWLLASIPELEIEGPAVLLAPLRIREWAQQRIGPSFPVRDIPAAGRERWFRSRTDEQLVFSFGLANVVQHELTHSMLALANDPVEERGEMDARRWQLYRKRPEIEEGLANFTAGVCSLVTLMKAKKGLKDNALPRLFRSPYEELWTKWQSLAYSTYAEYHADATDVYFKAWESNKLDYGAFAGLTKMFATNFSELNWEATFRALREGNIATGGKRSSPS